MGKEMVKTKEELLTKEVMRSLKMTPHAFKRAKERLNQQTELEALNFYKGFLGHQKCIYLGTSTSDCGNKGHQFTDGKRIVYIHLDLTHVLTVLEADKKSYLEPVRYIPELHQEIKSVYDKAHRKWEKKEAQFIKLLENETVEKGVEIAELKRRIYKTKSQKVKELCEIRLREVLQHLRDIETKLIQIQNEKRNISKARASLIAS